jgi:ornithine decarboxylase
MEFPRFRGAVAPLARSPQPAPLARAPRQAGAVLPRLDALVARLRPEEPLHALRPATLRADAARFVAGFPGTSLYAVKCNAEPSVLRALWAGGVRHFDCASIGEIRLVRSMFESAEIHFMHPVKPPSAIREAWERHGVRDFVLDAPEELAKVLAATGAGVGLFVRLALPKGRAALDLSGKFGAGFADAVALLRAARPHAARLGVAFHVGSQCLDPASWDAALALAGRIIREAGVTVDVVDVGGGFPAAYPGAEPPAIERFFAAIAAAAARELPAGIALWAEPGRALVARGVSVVLRVDRRRGGELFVNDGVYGALSDAGVPGFRFPTRLLRGSAAPVAPFAFWGPTCDSADFMRGPFLLPADVRECDWIEVGQLGAYGAALRTAFNGFDRAALVEVADDAFDEMRVAA